MLPDKEITLIKTAFKSIKNFYDLKYFFHKDLEGRKNISSHKHMRIASYKKQKKLNGTDIALCNLLVILKLIDFDIDIEKVLNLEIDKFYENLKNFKNATNRDKFEK